MRLTLIRHAHALDGEDDAARPLSKRGRTDIARIAAFLRENHLVRPAQVWHSPLLRSRETASLLLRELGIDPILVETPGLAPDDDPAHTADRLAEYPPHTDLAIVGHEPHLSALATLLVSGRAKPTLFHVRKLALLHFELTDDRHKRDGRPRWKLRWHLSPELVVAPLAPPGDDETARVR